jgi:hypothetical protein|tara:strand:+ start:4304 stop:4477 length:174 start_codon:yes stop_codon:yes gene_type:complete
MMEEKIMMLLEKNIECCTGCNVILDGYNSKGVFRTKKSKTIRCGKCYLEWKRMLRNK